MPQPLRKYLFAAVVLLIFAGVLFLGRGRAEPQVAVTVTPTVKVNSSPTQVSAHVPTNIPVTNGPLKSSVIAAGDYLMRQQLPNGELSYQVDFMSGERSYSPSHLRLMGGTGSLYTVCRVAEDSKYCAAGDLALKYYLEALVSDPQKFKGTCFYAEGSCQLGGAALTVDTIYKRWQATDDFLLEGHDLLATAVELGYFIVSMRKPEGGFYHAFDPHLDGIVDADYFAAYSPSQSLLALLDLYDMSRNEFWLKQAHEVNTYMLAQPITEDQWHGYAFSKLAQLDSLSRQDLIYAKQIADTIVVGEVRSLNPKNASISTSTKIEGTAALAQAFYLSGAEHKWLDPEIRAFIVFVQARQIPNNNCGWNLSKQMAKDFDGGIFNSCEEPTIRIDGLQNWINGVTAYLEYQSMIK